MSARRLVTTRPLSSRLFACLLVALAMSGMALGGLGETLLQQSGFYAPEEAQHDLVVETTLALAMLPRDLRLAGDAAMATLPEALEMHTTMVQIRADLDGDGTMTAADEPIRYVYEATTRQLRRQDSTGSVVVLDNVQDCTFTPLDGVGQALQDGRLARQIRVTLSMAPSLSALTPLPPVLFNTVIHLRPLS